MKVRHPRIASISILAFLATVLCMETAVAQSYASSWARQDDAQNQIRESTQIWQQMRMRFQLPSSSSQPEVKRWIRWYQKNPVHISRLQNQADTWIGYVFSEVDKRRLPIELALLPAVESAYDPLAYSHGQAAGIWQFIPPTATHLGLERNWWFDARRDVPQSTQAAMHYLSYLYSRFGDWLHALAAYNAGEGNVAGAIRRNRKRGLPTDFWSLDLPKETESYVPKLLALAAIIRNPVLYNIELQPIAHSPHFEIVEVDGQLDLAQAAELAGIDTDTVRRYNPGLNRWATPPDGPHQLSLPTYSVSRFKDGIKNLASEQRVTWRRHQVKSGETLGEIALRYKTSTGLLREINQVSGNAIRVNQLLLVAVGQKSLSAYPTALPSASGSKAKVRQTYTVQAGDSLWLIARRHDLNISDIERWNDVSRKKALQQGQQLVLWMTEGKKAKPRGRTHTVVAGDNLWDLARKYKVSVDKLRAWNGISKTHTLKLGSILRLAPAASDVVTRKLTYAVRSGDSLDYIARKFGVSVAQLCGWNDIHPTRYLQPGQRLRVHVPVVEQWRDA